MMRRLLSLVTILLGSHGLAQAQPVAPSEDLVRGLYTEVVARHPLGIPFGADGEVFSPYLSTGLHRRIDEATACAADWFRQNPDRDLKPPPIDLYEDGLFSGSSEQAQPRTFDIVRTEPMADGAARVHVKLTWSEAAGTPLVWYVAAVVVDENGRPVVDDVLFLKDDDLEIDGRLSEALGQGCDRPRWVE